MNDDRCQHVPTSPGQSVCTCLDTRMTLRFALQIERELNDYLLAKFGLTRADLPPINFVSP